MLERTQGNVRGAPKIEPEFLGPNEDLLMGDETLSGTRTPIPAVLSLVSPNLERSPFRAPQGFAADPIPGLFEQTEREKYRPPTLNIEDDEDEEPEPLPPPSRTKLMLIFAVPSVLGGILMLGVIGLWQLASIVTAPAPAITQGLPVQSTKEIPTPMAKVAEPIREAPAVSTSTPTKSSKRAEKAVAKSVVSQGKVRIRSNRRAMVWIDGKAIDFAPLDIQLSPGSHVIRAAEPGRPETEQRISVDVKEGDTAKVSLSF